MPLKEKRGKFVQHHDMGVYLAVFDKSSFLTGKALPDKADSYIDQRYVDEHHIDTQRRLRAEEDAFGVAHPVLAAQASVMPMANAVVMPRSRWRPSIRT